jgi:DNA-binding NtrC family response regulator
LLRVLDDGGEYHRLGASTASRSRFRLLGATNRDRAALKHDLAARLVLCLDVPGIDQRRDDIPLLARHLLRRAAVRSPEATVRFRDGAGPDLRIRPSLIQHLLEVPYATNVREMDSLLWQAMAASTGDAITWRTDPRAGDSDDSRPAEPPLATEPEPSPAQLRASLAEHRGNVVRTAQALGLTSRYVLYRLMRKHGIEG